jgi:hypothetical protein
MGAVAAVFGLTDFLTIQRARTDSRQLFGNPVGLLSARCIELEFLRRACFRSD